MGIHNIISPSGKKYQYYDLHLSLAEDTAKLLERLAKAAKVTPNKYARCAIEMFLKYEIEKEDKKNASK